MKLAASRLAGMKPKERSEVLNRVLADGDDLAARSTDAAGRLAIAFP